MTRGRKAVLTKMMAVLLMSPLGVAGGDISSWARSFNDGSMAIEDGRYAEAEMQLVEALRLAEEFGESDTRLAWTCHRLAWARYKAGKGSVTAEGMTQKGQAVNPGRSDTLTEGLARQGQAILERALGPNHIQVADGLTNLATIRAP